MPYPVLLAWCDNTSADSWIKRASRSSPGGKALGVLLCCYLINSPVGLRLQHISGKTNIIADRISRTHVSGHDPDFSQLLQTIPQLRSCRRYRLNPVLVSAISLALCSGSSPDAQNQRRINRCPLVNPEKSLRCNVCPFAAP